LDRNFGGEVLSGLNKFTEFNGAAVVQVKRRMPISTGHDQTTFCRFV